MIVTTVFRMVTDHLQDGKPEIQFDRGEAQLVVNVLLSIKAELSHYLHIVII